MTHKAFVALFVFGFVQNVRAGPSLLFRNETRCYGEIGSLQITREWYNLMYRPVNLFPLPRDVINTHFILYTRTNWVKGQSLVADDETSIEVSHFNPKIPTKFIIHGFLDSSQMNWVSDMRDELLVRQNSNVIVVDWSGGSSLLYTQATANTRLVGLEIAYLIKKLQTEYGLRPQDVHLIGFSLGAHTAGYAAEKIMGIGRITGLDPAEPYFKGMGSHVRLDPSDAMFVDVIHTDTQSLFSMEIPGYGMSQTCGHIDFYPNNGKEQPGCAMTQGRTSSISRTLIEDGIREASRVLVACDHIRAIKLFTDSINSKCPYVAHRCESYEEFMQGRCFNCNTNECALMGYHAQGDAAVSSEQRTDQVLPVPGKYFLTTGKEFPFCQRHYRLTIAFAKPKQAEHWVQGYLKASIISDNGQLHDIDLTKGVTRLDHGDKYQVFFPSSLDLGDNIREVELRWTYDGKLFHPRTLCLWLFCNDHLYVKSIVVETMEMPSRGKRNSDFSSKLCVSNGEYADIANRGSSIFYDGSCET